MRHAAPIAVVLLALAGCHNATWLPNTDGALNKPAKEFAADATSRFPYPADAPRGGEFKARAEVGYDANVINLANFSGGTLTDVELWVNKQYVIFLPSVEQGRAKFIPFKVIYNDKNEHLPESGVYVDTLEIKVGGTMYDVPKRVGG